jgi:flavin reductase (DIM6/NTAB) family NADH-FMN oxidoreductase RutF
MPEEEVGAMKMDAALFRAVMGRFTTGVTIISFLAAQRPAGMTANAFMSVSLDPPLVLTSIRTESRVNQIIGQDVRFGINILAEHQLDLCTHFAGKGPLEREAPFIFQQDTPLLAGSLAHFVVRTVNVIPAGDHLLYLGEVEYVKLGQQRKPLVFFTGGFRQVQAYTPVINWAGAAECS